MDKVIVYRSTKEKEDSNDLTTASIIHMCLHIYTGILKLKANGETFPVVINKLVSLILNILATEFGGNVVSSDSMVFEYSKIVGIYKAFLDKDDIGYDLSNNFSIDVTMNLLASLMSDPDVSNEYKREIYELDYINIYTFIKVLDKLCTDTKSNQTAS